MTPEEWKHLAIATSNTATRVRRIAAQLAHAAPEMTKDMDRIRMQLMGYVMIFEKHADKG